MLTAAGFAACFLSFYLGLRVAATLSAPPREGAYAAHDGLDTRETLSAAQPPAVERVSATSSAKNRPPGSSPGSSLELDQVDRLQAEFRQFAVAWWADKRVPPWAVVTIRMGSEAITPYGAALRDTMFWGEVICAPDTMRQYQENSNDIYYLDPWLKPQDTLYYRKDTYKIFEMDWVSKDLWICKEN